MSLSHRRLVNADDIFNLRLGTENNQWWVAEKMIRYKSLSREQQRYWVKRAHLDTEGGV